MADIKTITEELETGKEAENAYLSAGSVIEEKINELVAEVNTLKNE